ncbi:MFS transporter [Galactobacter valiniphilus]|uniref:Putative proline/betaine transporter n=1 Tax=Galactobacter valiniphilus TaxID=2676122 RepID=A0A399J968_9MICC|nr:MFS transporter [Galactobacter valiniphilus]RII41620.1 MFS transporter [Galactobacter valiniphilus]
MTSTATTHTANRRRVAAATIIGTTVEWYDFFIYANAVALVFNKQFFDPAGGSVGQLVAFASIGLSFLFRPLGAFLAGHYGDKIGRRAMLVITLLLMGAATALIGLLPTYAQIGIAAPILLLLLRVLQGISAGGEWGGAVLMAVEHADPKKRGLAGSFPQLGVPLGMLLASGVMALMTGVISPGAAFAEWGWRVPFLLSIVLILVGYWVRRSVDESPVFQEIAETKSQTKAPIVVLLKKYWYLVLLGALVFAGNNAPGYMTTGGFITKYTTKDLHMDQTQVLVAVAVGSAFWFITTLVGGILSDKIGRVRTYQIGFVCSAIAVFLIFPIMNTGSIGMLYLALALFSVGLGFTYGPQAALYSEMFPASVRFSGVSISYALGAILGGAFAPLIAQAILDATHNTFGISVYLCIVVVLGFVAVSLIRDRQGIDLSIRNEEEQASGATVFEKVESK